MPIRESIARTILYTVLIGLGLILAHLLPDSLLATLTLR